MKGRDLFESSNFQENKWYKFPAGKPPYDYDRYVYVTGKTSGNKFEGISIDDTAGRRKAIKAKMGGWRFEDWQEIEEKDVPKSLLTKVKAKI